MTVFVEIKVGQHSRENSDAQQAALIAMPEVTAAFLISGTADFLAEVVVEDLSAYERFLTEKLLLLPGVADIRSNFAIRTVKTGAPLKAPGRDEPALARSDYSQNEMRLLKGSMTITSSPQSCCSIPGFMKR